jgi:hypothetical protein
MPKIVVSLRSVDRHESTAFDVMINCHPDAQNRHNRWPKLNRLNTLILGNLVILQF